MFVFKIRPQVKSSETGPKTINRRAAILLSLAAAFGLCVILSLQVYSALTLRYEVIPSRVATEIDAKGRQEAIEIRKKTLPITGMPYPASDGRLIYPFADEAHQSRIQTHFQDTDSGLWISVDSHLCLPGIDQCISGGLISVSDGTSGVSITFQLLGSPSPSRFQSQLPKSAAFLDRLHQFAGGDLEGILSRDDFYEVLSRALNAEPQSAEQHTNITRLLRLLLSSYFSCDEYTDTVDFARRYQILH